MSASMSSSFIGAVRDEWRLFSDRAEDYIIGSPIGFGASSVVYAAVYNPSPPDPHPYPCALKVLDLDSLPPRSLALLQRETQLMSLSKHPNVLRVRGTWVDGHKLHIALRLMNKGSAADIMAYAWPDGMEEEVVKCILKQALEGLNYLHINGFIHRDVKAANLLVDDDGTVLVGDLGAAAPLTDDGERSGLNTTNLMFGKLAPQASGRPPFGKRKSFVGTPCWMAPELIQGKHYDAKADIWSFGITAIELTQGRPPRSRESAQAVLLQVVQGKSPTLDCKGGAHRCSHGFKETVDACLSKNPSERPTAAELLQTSFFRSSKKKSYLVGTILDGLPPLTMRQERHHRLDNLTVQRTADSWDFSSTVRSSNTPSLTVSNPRKSKSSSTPTEHNPGEKLDLCEDGTPEPSRPSVTTPSVKSKTMFVHHPTAASSPSRDRTLENPHPVFSHSSALVLPGDSDSRPPSPSFWDKLTRRPRAATTAGPQKGNTISRLLGGRSPSSLTQSSTVKS